MDETGQVGHNHAFQVIGRGVRRNGKYFQFEIPDGWEESIDGSRFVYRGPNDEELTVSATIVEGQVSFSQRQVVEGKLLDNALAAARETAAHPELKITKALAMEEGVCPLPCWTLVAETKAKDVLFCEAVVRVTGGILMVTLEGPPGPEALQVFRAFLGSLGHPEA